MIENILMSIHISSRRSDICAHRNVQQIGHCACRSEIGQKRLGSGGSNLLDAWDIQSLLRIKAGIGDDVVNDDELRARCSRSTQLGQELDAVFVRPIMGNGTNE